MRDSGTGLTLRVMLRQPRAVSIPMSFIPRSSAIALLIVGSLFAVGAYGQEDIRTNPLPPIEGEAPAEEQALNEQISAAEPELPTAEGAPAAPTVQVFPASARRFQYAFRLAIREVFDDNINLTVQNRVEDFYTSIEPAITLGLGDVETREENFLRLDYAPRIVIFADNSQDDAIQQSVRLEGQYRFSRLALGLGQDIQIVDGSEFQPVTAEANVNPINLDVSGRTRFNIYTTRLRAKYALTEKTSFSGGAYFSVYDYPDFISSETFSGDFYLNHAYGPKLTLGVGGAGGYQLVDDPNPNQTFEQINGRFSYELSGKLRMNGSLGVEFRQFDGPNPPPSYISPVFELDVSYSPFDGTTITLSGAQQTHNSAVLADQDFTTTNFVINARQRFLQRIFVGLAAGYEHASYFNTTSGINATRTDNYYFLQPSIDINVTRFWSAGVYYLHRQDDSSSDINGFVDHQIGIQAKLTF